MNWQKWIINCQKWLITPSIHNPEKFMIYQGTAYSISLDPDGNRFIQIPRSRVPIPDYLKWRATKMIGYDGGDYVHVDVRAL